MDVDNLSARERRLLLKILVDGSLPLGLMPKTADSLGMRLLIRPRHRNQDWIVTEKGRRWAEVILAEAM
jgi:hypothetical protein